jgi:uncharacterized protein (DUF58 family)
MDKPPIIPPPIPPVIPPPIPVALRRSIRQEFQKPMLTLEELERFKNLLIFAKSTVEGYFSGKHKSPFYGASAEFTDYKEYVQGEDPAHIDWRVYGRTRRFYVRQFQEETDMVIYLLVDTSASMRYGGDGRQAKFFLAAKIAAALAYLMIHQGDKAALALFSNKVNVWLPPGGTRRHLHRIVTELERVRPTATTGMAQAINDCAALFKKRGRLVILSDFLDDTEKVFEAFGQFMHRNFEILLIQILDPDELNLPQVAMARFVDMEDGRLVRVEPEEIRKAYRARLKEFVDGLAREADRRRISCQLAGTNQPYLNAIESYLGFRHGNKVPAR